MILIEDTHWPLVVVGVYEGAPVDPWTQRAASARWHSPELRFATLVVPGVGPAAISAHQVLLRWLRRHVSSSTPFAGAAWVIPDADVRGSVAALIDAHGGTAFGSPSAAFGSVSEALNWLRSLWCDDADSASSSESTVRKTCSTTRLSR